MKEQNLLFEDLVFKEPWEDDWQDMPEFIQEDLSSYRKIIVHFRNSEDVKKFSKLIGQAITPKQPSLWYPEMKHRITTDKEYADES